MVFDDLVRTDEEDLRIARAWRRLAAFFIDVVVVGTVLALLRWVVLGSLPYMAIVVLPLGYFWLITSKRRGKTVGKLALGIEVVTTNFEEPSLLTVFLREVVDKFLPIVIALSVAMATIIIDGFVLDGFYSVEECLDWCLTGQRPLYAGLFVGLATVFLVPSAVMLFSRRNQSLHDLVSDTLVIRRISPQPKNPPEVYVGGSP
jgi:uncharacterized RDD family membrane protein YckC